MKNITSAKLASIVLPFADYQFVSLTRFEECELVKKDRLTGEPTTNISLTKLSIMSNVGIGYQYSKSVNNVRKAEGNEEEFVAKPLSWGEFAEGSKVLINHKGSQYLRLSVFPNTKTETIYSINGHEVPYEEAMRVIKKKPSPIKASATQDTKKPTLVMAPKLAPIKKFNFNGENYIVGDQSDMIAEEVQRVADRAIAKADKELQEAQKAVDAIELEKQEA
jgi:hypothetical protein